MYNVYMRIVGKQKVTFHYVRELANTVDTYALDSDYQLLKKNLFLSEAIELIAEHGGPKVKFPMESIKQFQRAIFYNNGLYIGMMGIEGIWEILNLGEWAGCKDIQIVYLKKEQFGYMNPNYTVPLENVLTILVE